MLTLTHASQLRKLEVPVMLAAGFFDGVHKGHQEVLNATVRRARETGGQAWALTFDRHPLAVLAPSKAPPLLNTRDERIARLGALGLDGVLVLPFTRQLALLTPEAFVRQLCGEPETNGPPPLRLCEIRCGANWRFGRRAEGTPETLARLGGAYGFSVVIVKYAEYQGEEISSTRIRQAICGGALGDVASMLGGPYTISGTVMPGRGDGARLGFPTANVTPHAEVLPPPGVYATRTRLPGGGEYASVSDLGTSPTFGGGGPLTLETHLLGYPGGPLYGQHIEVALIKRIRDEQTFASPTDLAAQIRLDIEASEQIKEIIDT